MASGFGTGTGTGKRESKRESKRDNLVSKRTHLVLIVMTYVTYTFSFNCDDVGTLCF